MPNPYKLAAFAVIKDLWLPESNKTLTLPCFSPLISAWAVWRAILLFVLQAWYLGHSQHFLWTDPHFPLRFAGFFFHTGIRDDFPYYSYMWSYLYNHGPDGPYQDTYNIYRIYELIAYVPQCSWSFYSPHEGVLQDIRSIDHLSLIRYSLKMSSSVVAIFSSCIPLGLDVPVA